MAIELFWYPASSGLLLMLALATLAIRPAWGQETLVVDQSDNRGWVFVARA